MKDRRRGVIGLAVLQAVLSSDRVANVDLVEGLARRAAAEGANIVVPPELFEVPYFPRERNEGCFELARPLDGNPAVDRFRRLAAEMEIVIPFSFFERDGRDYYNSVAVIDADGSIVGVYRKSHIPHGPGYEERYYFRAGDLAPRSWCTRFCRLGVGVCWDQWFPECARMMALEGADIIAYPSAIGSEPEHPEWDTSGAWRRVMQGHAAANAVVVVASNRVGREGDLEFFGGSLITGVRGEVLAELRHPSSGFASASLDLDEMSRYREFLGLLDDRRPELYSALVRVGG